jgi:Domain of unknown function (DUF4836)
MKKWFRIGTLFLLVLAGTGMLLWYSFIRRTLPQQAISIPQNAIAVCTFNLRELAMDFSSNDHLFPEFAKEQQLPAEFISLSKAIEKNGGAGIKKTADVLGFVFQEKEEAWGGIALLVEDSAKLSSLLRQELVKKFPASVSRRNGISILNFDSSAAVMGWTADRALILYPIGDHEKKSSLDQLVKLLEQKKEASILSNADFCEHELKSFDLGCWVNAKSLLTFTNGGKLIKYAVRNDDYLSFEINFEDGEVQINNVISGVNQHRTNTDLFLPCDSKEVFSWMKTSLDLSSDSLRELAVENPLVGSLPFSDEETIQLFDCMDGSCSFFLHDTISVSEEFIKYKYDENFNQTEVKEIQYSTETAASISFGLSDEKQARELISKWMAEDSVSHQGDSWLYEEEGKPVRLLLNQKSLTYTDWPGTNGRKHPIPANWNGYQVWFDLHDYVNKSDGGLVEFFFARFLDVWKLVGQHAEVFTVSNPVIGKQQTHTYAQLSMRNKEVNALIQLTEIVRKGMK